VAVRPAGRRPQRPRSPAEELEAPRRSPHARPRPPRQRRPSGRPLRSPPLRIRRPRQQHLAPRHRRRRTHPLDPIGPNVLGVLNGLSLPRRRVARRRALNRRHRRPMLNLRLRRPAP